MRGRSRSRNPQKIIEEINAINPKEAVINGINLSAYDYNGKTLTDLMESLSEINCRIRLGSLEVRVIDDKFLTALKNLKNFAPHFHLSLQSGANAVLKKMNRHYTTEEYLQKVDLIRKYFPTAGITTDIIAGFPTETEEHFIETLNFVDKVKFSDIHPFTFSPRSGTVAFKMQDLSGEIKHQRLNRMLEKKAECKARFIESFIGKELNFLPEEYKDGYTEGYSENYLRLYVEQVKSRDIIKVRVVEPFKDGAKAQII